MTNTTPTVEFTVDMADFKRKLKATGIALDKDKWAHPALTIIRVTVHEGQLMMVATDRYKVIATRCQLVENTHTTPGELFIDRRALKYLGMMTTGPWEELTVKLWEGKVEFSTPGETLSVAHPQESYPNIEPLLKNTLNGKGSDRPNAFGPNHLNDVTKSFLLLHPKASMVIQGNTKENGRQEAALIYGHDVDDWVAMLMPVRFSDMDKLGQVVKKAFGGLVN